MDFPSMLATIYSLLYQNCSTRCRDFASLPLVWPGGFTKAPSYSQRTSLITDSLLTFTTFSESSSLFTVSSDCSSLQFVIKLETYLHKFMRRSIYGRTFTSVLLNRVLIACLLVANCGKICWKCLFWLPGFLSSTPPLPRLHWIAHKLNIPWNCHHFLGVRFSLQSSLSLCSTNRSQVRRIFIDT